jgi:diguanylate cyclase (GGDEF)-like protein/PAS domain S-box-containing protein
MGYIAIWVVTAVLCAVALLLWRRERRRARAAEVALDEAITDLTQAKPTPTPTPTPTRESSFGDLMRVLHDPVILHGQRIILANQRFAGLLERDSEELVGHHLSDFLLPEYGELVRDTVRRRLAGEPAAEVYEVEVADVESGRPLRLELGNCLVRYGNADVVAFSATPIQPNAANDYSRSRAAATLDSIGDGLLTTDASGRIDFINPRAADLLGRTPAEVDGRLFSEVVSVVDEADRRVLADPVKQCLASGVNVSIGRRAVVLRSADGSEHGIELTAAPLLGSLGQMEGCVVLLHDVTELRGIARQMSYQASHDALTGLVNRHEFERRLQECLDTARSGRQTHVLCYLDLDRFKAVNDTSGHMAGDAMLREIAVLLKRAVRDSDTVARIGGDEFAVLLAGCPLDKAIQIAQDISAATRDFRFAWKDRTFQVGVSIGLVEIGRDNSGPDEVLAAADSACYVAKNQSAGQVHVYSAVDEATARQRGEIHWLQRIQQALRDGRFLLYTQEILASPPGSQRGPAMEVLVRMIGDDGAVIGPGEFLKAAERYRLMPMVDRWVVQAALTALGNGGLSLPHGRSLAINLSGQTLADGGFLEFVVDCLDHSGVLPQQICFEVTESSVIANFEQARRFIGVLHGMGCSFALDDFGSGIGSFTQLRSLPMDYLKIDGTYMRNLNADSVNQAMVQAMVRLARTLNFAVIAEQVEDQATLTIAQRMGVDYAQGFAISRPEPMRTKH